MTDLFTAAGATFDAGRRYRYTLWRDSVEPDARACLWIMLNPSTADERVLDPTLRRCMAYGLLWGYSSMRICNLFALRSTDPEALYTADDPVGPDNDRAILSEALRADRIVVGWGAHGVLYGRAAAVARSLRAAGHQLWCLGTTHTGQPRHPLYLPATRELRPWEIGGGA